MKIMENRLKLLEIIENNNLMLNDDRERLKEIMTHYPVKEFMKVASEVALEVAGDITDLQGGHSPPIAKEFTQLSVLLDELVEGRPFLV